MTLLGPDQGLPSGTIITMTQDQDGFLWMGSENGLIRYDGRQYRRWTEKDGLPSLNIQRVIADPQGGIWVGTMKGLMRFKEGRLETTQFDSEPTDTPISFMTLDHRNRLWCATIKGIFRQGYDLQFNSIPYKPPDRLLALTTGNVTGNIYLASSDGILVFDQDILIHHWSEADGLPPDGSTLVIEDRLGRVWAGSGQTLVMKEPHEDRFRNRSQLLPASLSPNSVPFVDSDGSLWLPTQNGALHLTDNKSILLDISHGLPFRWVRTVFRDREGSLWVIGPTLARMLGNGRLRNYSLTPGAYGEVVWKVILNSENRMPVVGTDDGAAVMTPAGLKLIPGTKGLRIKDLMIDRSKMLWMVSSIGPTLWLKKGQKQAEPAPLGDMGRFVNTVFEDSLGTVWLGHSRHGLLSWDPLHRSITQAISPESMNAKSLGIFAFGEDPFKRLWVGSTSGVFIRQNDGQWLHFDDKSGLLSKTVRALAFMADGSAWIAYQEPRGLTHVELKGRDLTVLEHVDSRNGIVSDAIYAIAVDSHQQVWISTDQGVGRLTPPLRIGRAEGMVSEDCAIGALLIDGDHVWVGTASGLIRYDSGDTDKPVQAPVVHLLEIQYGSTHIEAPFPRLKPLPALDSAVQFRIASPTYLNQHSLLFRVRLLGLEQEWRETVGQFFRYPVLPGGRYRFEAQARIGNGDFGPLTVFEFSVSPIWWQTWWAYSLFSIFSLLLLFLIIRWRISSLAKSKSELEALVTERTLELSQRNEELSQALTNVKQLSGLLPICSHCKKIRDDKGYWNQLEAYISDHTDADFSHGICPSCAQDLYPSFFDKDKTTSEK